MTAEHARAIRYRTPGHRLVSYNVKVLMALRELTQDDVAEIIGNKSGAAVGHKLAGRSGWKIDDVEALSAFGGREWPIARFFTDPGRNPGGEPRSLSAAYAPDGRRLSDTELMQYRSSPVVPIRQAA